LPTEKGVSFRLWKAFYNPKAEVARGLGILAARVARPLSIFETFAGGGTRTLLYARYVQPTIHHVNEGHRGFLCELLHNYFENALPTDGLRITVSDFLTEGHGFVCEGLKYDWVDLDPFGSPSPFLAMALGLVKSGGYVYITSTDTATLSGKRRGDDVRLYGVALRPWETYAEMGARALIYSVWNAANNLNLHIRPVFVYYEGYAYRLLVRVRDRRNPEGVGFVQRCKGCGTYSVSVRAKGVCGVCGGENELVGPLWTGALYDRGFLRRMFDEAKTLGWRKEQKVLKKMIEEVDVPMYYPLDAFRFGRMPSPSYVVKVLRKAGFKASRTQFHPGAVKTDAPRPEIVVALS